MTLTPAEVRKIAHLARLSINDTEIEPLTKSLDNILNLVGKMDRADVTHVKQMAHPLETAQPLRTDQVTEVNLRDQFLKNAPQSLMGLYIVPQVIETEE